MPTKPIWKDITTFSQGDKERKPTTWELRLSSSVRIIVTSGHRYYPGQWIMHCEPWYDTYLLKTAKSLEQAQCHALWKVKKEVDVLVTGLAEAIKIT